MPWVCTRMLNCTKGLWIRLKEDDLLKIPLESELKQKIKVGSKLFERDEKNESLSARFCQMKIKQVILNDTDCYHGVYRLKTKQEI